MLALKRAGDCFTVHSETEFNSIKCNETVYKGHKNKTAITNNHLKILFSACHISIIGTYTICIPVNAL